jgi:DNA-binding NtrC family response regulator
MGKRLYPEYPILLVDDEEHFLSIMKATLRLNGISHVECCSDSRDVMTLLAQKKYSLILLDILMPHINGDELLPGIIEKYPDVKVIVLTALNDEAIALKCKDIGAFDYIIKPFDSDQLIASIQEVLNDSKT